MRGGSSVSNRGRGTSGYGTVSSRCHYCNKEGHWKNQCFIRKNDVQKGNGEGHLAFVGLATRGIGTGDWIIDSGASRHLTAHRELLEDYITVVYTSITIGNRKEIMAVGQGNITLHIDSGIISLPGVLHVPNIGSNLISIASIVDKGFQVEFTAKGCVVSKGNTERVIGKGQGNVYYLLGLQDVACTGISWQKDTTTKEIWHRRIAYCSISEQAVENLRKSVTDFGLAETMASEEPICTICAEGKQSRENLTGQRKKSEELLHTIHSDVCGPLATTGFMGDRYFTTFIDEWSGRIALSLLTQKSEVFERFKQYKAKVERETGKKVK